MFKSLVIVGLGNFVNGFGGFLYLLAVSKTLSVEDYGKYSFLIAVFILLAKLTELGTTGSYVSLSIKENKNYSKALFVLKITLVSVVFLISTIILQQYGFGAFSIWLAFLIGYIGYALNDYLFTLFQKSESFIKTTLVNMIPALVKGIAALVLLYNLPNTESLNTVIYIYFTSLLASAFLIPYVNKEKISQVPIEQGIKRLAQVGFPAGVSQAINLAIPNVNNNLILLRSSFVDLGIFALAEKLSSIFALASVSILTVILPKKAKELKETKKYDFTQVYYLSFTILACAVVMILLARPLIYNLFEKYLDALPILYILTISASFTAITGFLDNFFFVYEKTKSLLIINTLKLISISFGVFIFYPIYGLQGAAYANLISSLLFLLITFAYIHKVNKL